MKNKISLIIAWFILGTIHSSAGSSENKAQFQFANISLTENSWDYASLQYNINDVNTGEGFAIPSYMIGYEVKDKSGSVLAKGQGTHISTMDSKLGSEEEYTIVISTLVNGEKLTHTICRKASPKKFTMKVNPTDLDNNHLQYTFSRPKFNNRNETENIRIAASDVELNIALNNVSYKIQAGANHPALAEQEDYCMLKSEMEKQVSEGHVVEMAIEPRAEFKGHVYTDAPAYYQITAGGTTEVSSLDPIASK
jgi:hypothetical protein